MLDSTSDVPIACRVAHDFLLVEVVLRHRVQSTPANSPAISRNSRTECDSPVG